MPCDIKGGNGSELASVAVSRWIWGGTTIDWWCDAPFAIQGAQMKARLIHIAMASIVIALPGSASALNLGKMLKEALQGEGGEKGAQQTPQGASGAPTSTKSQSAGAYLTQSYCSNLFSLAGISNKNKADENLVLEEFNLGAPGDFFDAFTNSVGYKSYTFPSLKFYQGEFETDKVNVLYNLLLSYPSHQYAAALIAESRKTHESPQYDHQAKVDALAALTMIHFYMRDKSKSPNRWRELATSLQREEHYTAQVITARLLKSGEMGVVDPTKAITLAREANDLRGKYSREQGYRTMSSRNYAIRSNLTLYETVVANPQNSQSRYFTQFVQQYELGLKNQAVVPEVEAQLAPGLKAIEKASKSAAEKAKDVLAAARQGSTLKAEKVSLDNAMRSRTSDSTDDVNIDDRTMKALTRQLETLTSLDDKQKQKFASALSDMHESGDRAIGLMPAMMSAVLSQLNRYGLGGMPAILPYSMRLQAHSDAACSVVARWDQAAQVTGASNDSERSQLASFVSGTGK